MVARLAQQEFANNPNAVLVIVSDHGFMNISHYVNLVIPFLQAGLIQGSVNPATRAPVVQLMEGRAVDGGRHGGNHAARSQRPCNRAAGAGASGQTGGRSGNGIAEVLDREAIAKRGAFPDAAFLVVLKPGYYTGGGLSGSLVTPVPGTRGSHGFSPEFPEMRASFFAVGAGIAHHRDLGVVDMRQIAPTVAGILRVPMPTAKATPLHVQP